jgi:hypothetical protein
VPRDVVYGTPAMVVGVYISFNPILEINGID